MGSINEFRISGPRTGSDLGQIDVTINGVTQSATVAQYRKPDPVSGLPRLNSLQFRGDAMSVDTTGLTGITAYDWRVVGGATFSTTNPVTAGDANAYGGQVGECAITCDQGLVVSPPFLIYTNQMMGMTMPASHTRDDKAILAIVPHSECTHIADTDGNWTDPATWRGGVVPSNGATFLIEEGVTVTYDNALPNVRLDRGRVDGDLIWTLSNSTEMLIETLVVTRGASMVIGTSGGRIPANIQHEIIISGKDYSADSFDATDLKSANFAETRGWGRGVVVQGTCRIWGREKTTWFKADPIDVGATSLSSRQPLIGVEVGDEICIGGTDITYTYNSTSTHAPVYEDEYRTITGVSGNMVVWDAPLEFPHKNQLRTSTRTDLYPNIMVRRGKNVIFRSEVTTPNWRRGHFAVMHHWATLDVWDLEVIEFGRTDKSTGAGVIDDNDDFYRSDAINPAGTQGDNWRVVETLTPQSNLVARYSAHAHLLGYNHMGDRPVFVSVYVEGSPGWPFVHHDCDMDMINCVAHRFWGCGMVSESGSEVGAWIGNLMMTSTYESRPNVHNGAVKNLYGEPKNLAGPEADEGDTFREGYGYGFRGRGMRTNRNVANSVTYGNVFYHRFNSADAIQPPVNLRRDVVDIAAQNLAQNPNGVEANDNDFVFVDYPIVHHADNESVACLSGLFVSKELHLQDHDVNVKLKRMKTWGYALHGASVEYIGVYIIDGFDAVAGDRYRGTTTGFRIGANTYQNAVVNLRSEGNSQAVYINPQDTTDHHDDFTRAAAPNNNLKDPRWFSQGVDSVNDGQYIGYGTLAGRTKTPQEVTLDRRDWFDLDIDYDRDPISTGPALMGARNDWASRETNATTGKNDNVSADADIYFKPMDDSPFFTLDSRLDTYRNGAGYYTVSGGPADGLPCVVQAIIISDRLTGRPSKRAYFWNITGHVSGTNNGTYTYTTTAVTCPDKTAAVAIDGSVVVNALTGAAGGGGGGTYELDAATGLDALNGDYIAPDHGVASLNAATGEVTYTPDAGYAGTDEMYVFVKSQGQYATVRITFLINAGATEATPAVMQVGANFSAAAVAGSPEINVTLDAHPDTDERRIDLVQYTTDGGTNWRRLCHRWVKATHVVTLQSDGTALVDGASYNLELRYKTDYDFVHSGASSPVSISLVAQSDTIYASATGNDSTGNGTSGNPYRTVLHALGQASSGEVVRYNDGTTDTDVAFDDIFVSTSGTNSGAGAYNAPYATAQYASGQASAGDKIWILPGTYTPNTTTWQNSGTAGNPIVCSGLPDQVPGATVFVGDLENHAIYGGSYTNTSYPTDTSKRDGFYVVGKDYITFRNFRVEWWWRDGFFVRGNPSEVHGNIILEDIEVENVGFAGIGFYGQNPDTFLPSNEGPDFNHRLQDVAARRCDVSHTNMPTQFNFNAQNPNGGGADVEAISIAAGVKGFIIEDCIVHDTFQYGIDAKAGVRDGIIRNNEVYNVEKYGIYLDSGARFLVNIQVYNNRIYKNGNNQYGMEHGIAIAREHAADGGVYSIMDGIYVHSNEVWNTDRAGLYVDDHPGDGATATSGSIDNLWIAFNTFYNNATVTGADYTLEMGALAAQVSAGVTTNTYFVGNIVGVPSGSVNSNDDWSGTAGFTVDDNYLTAGPSDFVDAANADFTLTGGSGAKGLVASQYIITQLLTDAAGTTRTAPASAGAYE